MGLQQPYGWQPLQTETPALQLFVHLMPRVFLLQPLLRGAAQKGVGADTSHPHAHNTLGHLSNQEGYVCAQTPSCTLTCSHVSLVLAPRRGAPTKCTGACTGARTSADQSPRLSHDPVFRPREGPSQCAATHLVCPLGHHPPAIRPAQPAKPFPKCTPRPCPLPKPQQTPTSSAPDSPSCSLWRLSWHHGQTSRSTAGDGQWHAGGGADAGLLAAAWLHTRDGGDLRQGTNRQQGIWVRQYWVLSYHCCYHDYSYIMNIQHLLLPHSLSSKGTIQGLISACLCAVNT